jgi:isoprenylcysteine carboxyl methyltransferase (ICMT) family protein YpbQ
MWKNVFDGLKAAVVLLLLVTGIIALPFFLAAVVTIAVGYVIYIIIREVRIERERNEAKIKSKQNA